MPSPSSLDYLVTGLPGLTNSKNPQYAGSIPIHDELSSSDKNLFFWYFPQKLKHPQPLEPLRLLFWFAGGPGCSSLTEPLSGNGPLVLTEDGKVVDNDAWSWNELAHVVYVDSPFGTGYSRSPNGVKVMDEEVLGNDFLKFLFKFLDLFPELKKSYVYLAGRGYAGISVPYMARSILSYNRGVTSHDKKIHLQAIILNNGFVSPKFHYGSVRRYLEAYDKSQTETDRRLMERLPDNVQRELKGKHHTLMHHYYEHQPEPIAFHHWNAYKTYLLEQLRKVTAPCFDWHDISKVRGPEDCETDTFDKGAALERYFNNDDTRIALNVPDVVPEWKTCRTDEVLEHDPSLPSYMHFNVLLQDIRIVMYNGDRDLEANYFGTEEFLKSIPWGSRMTPGWVDPTLVGWGKRNEADDDMAYGRSERRLTYMRIPNSGYEVSESKPEVAYRLLKEIVFDEKGSAVLEPGPSSADQLLTDESFVLSPTKSTTTRTVALVLLLLLIFLSIAGIIVWIRHRRLLRGADSTRGRSRERDPGTRSGSVVRFESKPRKRPGVRGKYSPVDSRGNRIDDGESSGELSDVSDDA